MIGGVKGQDFAYAETAVEVALLGDDGDALLDADGVGSHVETHDGGGAGGGQHAGDQHADGGGFAGAVGSQQAEDLAGAHAEGDAVDGVYGRLRVAFNEVADFYGRGGGGHGVLQL